MMKKIKLYSCKFCGNKFQLLKRKRYTAIGNQGVASALNGITYYDCFDCPECGCQNSIHIRFQKLENKNRR